MHRDNNFFELQLDRVSIDVDFNTGGLEVKDGYVASVVNETYIKNNIENESWYKDNYKYIGECILKRCALCYMNLDDVSCVNKTIVISVYINKFQNYKYKRDDFYYFECENNPTFHYKHYSFLIFPEMVTDNYIGFNNTTQRIKYTDIVNKTSELSSIMFNFIIEPDKRNIDINSTLLATSNSDNYIILYNNQGIVFRFGVMFENTPTTHIIHNEIIVPTTETLLNTKYIISFSYGVSPKIIFVIVNDSILYDKNNINIGGRDLSTNNVSMFTHQYHGFYLCNNNDNMQSFNMHLPGYLSHCIITGDSRRPHMLLSTADNRLYIIELTVGFETNLNNNTRRKELKYHSLLTDLSSDYHTIEFVNLSMSCLGIFGQSSVSFLKICTELDFDNHHLNFIVSKLSTIIIRTTYYIFCMRNKSWCNPELLSY